MQFSFFTHLFPSASLNYILLCLLLEIQIPLNITIAIRTFKETNHHYIFLLVSSSSFYVCVCVVVIKISFPIVLRTMAQRIHFFNLKKSNQTSVLSQFFISCCLLWMYMFTLLLNNFITHCTSRVCVCVMLFAFVKRDKTAIPSLISDVLYKHFICIVVKQKWVVHSVRLMIMSLNTNPKIVVSLLFFLCPFQLSDHILISEKSNGSCLDGKSPHWQHFIISCGQKGNLTGYFFL